MTTMAVAPYRLNRFEAATLNAAREERTRHHDSQGYAFARRQGLIVALGMIINHAEALHPLRMTDPMQQVFNTALGLADCGTVEGLRAWLVSHHIAPAAMVPRILDVEYGAGAGAANLYVEELVHIVEVMTRG
jgi:hypothetical protein